jgi:hypothetical protein
MNIERGIKYLDDLEKRCGDRVITVMLLCEMLFAMKDEPEGSDWEFLHANYHVGKHKLDYCPICMAEQPCPSVGLNEQCKPFWKGDGYVDKPAPAEKECEHVWTPVVHCGEIVRYDCKCGMSKPHASLCNHKWEHSHDVGNQSIYKCRCGLYTIKEKDTITISREVAENYISMMERHQVPAKRFYDELRKSLAVERR